MVKAALRVEEAYSTVHQAAKVLRTVNPSHPLFKWWDGPKDKEGGPDFSEEFCDQFWQSSTPRSSASAATQTVQILRNYAAAMLQAADKGRLNVTTTTIKRSTNDFLRLFTFCLPQQQIPSDIRSLNSILACARKKIGGVEVLGNLAEITPILTDRDLGAFVRPLMRSGDLEEVPGSKPERLQVTDKALQRLVSVKLLPLEDPNDAYAFAWYVEYARKGLEVLEKYGKVAHQQYCQSTDG